MKTNRFVQVPGQAWLSRSAAMTAYRLSSKEVDLICRELKDTGGWCPRKGIAAGALDRIVQRMRTQA